MAQWSGMKFYFDDIASIEQLEYAEVGEFFLGCMRYGATGEIPKFKGAARIIWPLIKTKIDRDHKKYDDTCQTNAYNRYKGVCAYKGETPLSQEEWETTIYLPRLTSVNECQPSSPNVTVDGNVNCTVNFTEDVDGEGSGGRRGRTSTLHPLPEDEEAKFERMKAERIDQLRGYVNG